MNIIRDCELQCIICSTTENLSFCNYAKFHRICPSCRNMNELDKSLDCNCCNNKIKVFKKNLFHEVQKRKSNQSSPEKLLKFTISQQKPRIPDCFANTEGDINSLRYCPGCKKFSEVNPGSSSSLCPACEKNEEQKCGVCSTDSSNFTKFECQHIICDNCKLARKVEYCSLCYAYSCQFCQKISSLAQKSCGHIFCESCSEFSPCLLCSATFSQNPVNEVDPTQSCCLCQKGLYIIKQFACGHSICNNCNYQRNYEQCPACFHHCQKCGLISQLYRKSCGHLICNDCSSNTTCPLCYNPFARNSPSLCKFCNESSTDTLPCSFPICQNCKTTNVRHECQICESSICENCCKPSISVSPSEICSHKLCSSCFIDSKCPLCFIFCKEPGKKAQLSCVHTLCEKCYNARNCCALCNKCAVCSKEAETLKIDCEHKHCNDCYQIFVTEGKCIMCSGDDQKYRCRNCKLFNRAMYWNSSNNQCKGCQMEIINEE